MKTGLVQDFDMQIQGVFKDYSRTKINILRSCKIIDLEYTGSLKSPCAIFLKLFHGYFLKLHFVLSIAVNEVNSKLSQMSRSVINFQGRNIIFKEF